MFKAILDNENTYFGMEEVSEIKDFDVEVPADCDLPIGKYKYNFHTHSFEPLKDLKKAKTPNAPLAERALYELINATKNPPEYCVVWAKWYKDSVDNWGK